jgi:hypothetical protein
MDEERTKTKGFSVRKEREAELDAALRKMKMMRPFDSVSEIIIDAIVEKAGRMGQGDGALDGAGHGRPGAESMTPV